MDEFRAGERGSPEKVAETIATEIRGEHDAAADPKGWQHTLRSQVAAAVSAAVRGVGGLLVNRDLHERTVAYQARVQEWRDEVEAKRAEYDALPESEKKGFTAPKEPDFGPLPEPHPIGADCSGSVDENGITSLAVNVALAPE